MTAITVTQLAKNYHGATEPAVADFSIAVNSGEMLTFLGPSGCGKTSVLKIMAGLLDATSGDVAFDGRSIMAIPPEKRGAAMVFQNHLLFSHMTVAANIGFGLRMRGDDARQIARDVDAMLERMQLQGLGSRQPLQLSGGQQQRVALARALVIKPKVLLLDEPLSSLDTNLRRDMRDFIRELQREFGITTIMVTHDHEDAAAISDRIAVMFAGRLAQCDVPSVLYMKPANHDVARYFGGVNFVAGNVEGRVFTSSIGALILPDVMAKGQATLTIRPEHIRLARGPHNNITATVIERSPVGLQWRLKLQCANAVLEARIADDEAAGVTVGTSVNVHLPERHLWVLPQS